MKSWLCSSVLAACVLPALHPAAVPSAQTKPARHNELTLARLRPGQDKLAAAIALYGRNYRRVVPDSDDVLACVDRRRKSVLRVELEKGAMIESVTLSTVDPLLDEPAGTARASLPTDKLGTGRGLALGAACEQAVKLYGRPGSRGPSTQQGRELEFLFYAFEWAGSGVPQVMEVTCERASNRVVQITLAFPSL